MPQFHRKVAFSNKQKKEQLQAKRGRRKNGNSEVENPSFVSGKSSSENHGFGGSRKFLPPSRRQNVNSLDPVRNNYLDNAEEIQGGGVASHNNRYNLKFRKDHVRKEHLKKLQYEPVSPLPQEELEVDSETFYPSGLDYPKRPLWKKGVSKEELDRIENRSFRLFCEEIDKTYDSEKLSLYELNLETWRQLWRVTEMSDIVLIVVDARFVAAQFPPYLYKHLVEKENKGVILVMNKCDLIPSSLVIAWTDFCSKFYPKLIVVPFSSFEGKAAKKSTLKIALHSSMKLIDSCQKLVDDNVDLSSWRKKVEEEMKDETIENCKILKETISTEEEKYHPIVYQRYKDNVLTIGTIGHPNVGKSSLINALMGKKVVSVSKTPGHTKHFQTIFITKNVKLCDCPGLVFPSLCPKQLQVVLGSYPIAQVRNPLAAIHYIACRINMPKILKLNPSDIGEDEDFRWTPFHISEAWAKKRSYYTRTKGGRLDVFRAANELLRFTLVGLKGLIIALAPFGYSKNKDFYNLDSRLHEIAIIQNLENENNLVLCGSEKSLEEESEETDSDESSLSNRASATKKIVDSSDEEEEEEIGQNKFSLLALEDC